MDKISYTEMKQQAIVATCQLAKRQRTWFRKEIDAIWCDSESVQSDLGVMVKLICGDIEYR
jgi:tRNA A37 N6-isopentenylltransferase MiaA